MTRLEWGAIALVAAVFSPARAARAQALSGIAPTLPGVIGKTLDSALNVLAWTKLKIVQIESVTTAAPRGTIVAQRPRGGTLLRLIAVDTLVWASPARQVPIGAVTRRAVAGIVPAPTSTSTSTGPPAPTARDTILGSLTHVFIPGSTGRVPGVVVRDDTYVPQLVGRTPQAATALLKEARLKAGDAARDYSNDVAAGLVFRQHPEYSRVPVAAGTAVDVWYSLGPRSQPAPAITVPSVVGLTLAQAADPLKRAQLQFGHVDSISIGGANGAIQHQRPDPGSVARAGDAVDLTIAVAPQFVTVPDVSHMSRDSAEATLKRVKLGLGRVTLVATPSADTTIIAQHPTPHTDVEPGSLVDVIENRPVVVRRGVVPSLTGLTREEATSLLARDSLYLGDVLVAGDTLARTIASQDPPAGTSVFYYSAVNVTLQGSVAPPAADSVFIRIPSVINASAAQARATLSDSGFANVSVTGDSATAAAIVTSQSPSAGTLALPASTVALTVAAPGGPPVPNLLGLDEAAARVEAGYHQMLMTVGARHRGLRLRDVVVGQSPAPPALGPPDNTISVDLDIPIVPPIPAAIVVLAAAIAATVRPKPSPQPVTVHLAPVAKAPSVPSLATDAPSLIRHSVTMRYGATASEWSSQPNDQSLIKSRVPSNV